MAGQEYHYQIADEGRAGLSRSPASMRNSPPQAVLWTDGYRSAPCLAVFDAGISHTDGLGAPSNVASATLSEASRQLTYPVAGYFVFKEQGGDIKRTPSLCIGNK